MTIKNLKLLVSTMPPIVRDFFIFNPNPPNRIAA